MSTADNINVLFIITSLSLHALNLHLVFFIRSSAFYGILGVLIVMNFELGHLMCDRGKQQCYYKISITPGHSDKLSLQ